MLVYYTYQYWLLPGTAGQKRQRSNASDIDGEQSAKKNRKLNNNIIIEYYPVIVTMCAGEDDDAFIEGIEQQLKKDEKINKKIAHSIFVGPPGSGKSSLMDKLLDRPTRIFSASTGICEPTVVAYIGHDNPSTLHSVTMSDPHSWKEVEYDTSIVRQFDRAASPVKVEAASEMNSSSAPQSAVSERDKVHVAETKLVVVKLATASTIHSTTKPLANEMKDMLRLVVEKCGGYSEFKKSLLNSIFLYMRDTGGHMVFQEMLSLLTLGPSLFIFVFRADKDIKKKFEVEFRMKPGESLKCNTSSITTEEALLQCLASVYAMDTPGKAGVKTHKPLVFIVGTHKDKLGPSADEKIAKLDDHFDSLIRNNSCFRDLVQYADADKHQVMFTVDNTSSSGKDIDLIKAKIYHLINERNEFTIEYPFSYLLFCLELHNDKRSVLTFEDCEVIAAKYGIINDRVSHLLEFLHFRIGVIQYFSSEGIVMNKPQVLYSKVTDLVKKTFSSKSLISSELHDLQKGILTESTFENISISEEDISPDTLLKLLIQLHIMIPIPSTVGKEERYFIPCVLNHVQESTEEEMDTDILPLAVRFKCAHCPKGLFGVLVTHLMTHYSHESEESPSSSSSEEEANSQPSFTLIEDKIFKDQVSFEVHSSSEQDELSLKVFSSHIEINVFPGEDQDQERELSISEVCNNIRQVLETSILKSLEDLHYNRHNVKPVMCFRCNHCSELHEVKRGKIHKVYCNKTHKNTRLPLQGRCWFNEGQYISF